MEIPFFCNFPGLFVLAGSTGVNLTSQVSKELAGGVPLQTETSAGAGQGEIQGKIEENNLTPPVQVKLSSVSLHK